MFTIHVVHSFANSVDDEFKRKVLEGINSLNTKITTMARKIEEINEQMAEINAATNNIAADLDRLASQAEGGLTAEEATSHVAALKTVSDQLKAIAAKNPETGEPTPPPSPEPGL